MDNKIGEAIKKERVDRLWTINELSKNCGVCRQEISAIERGIRKNPSIITLARINKAFKEKPVKK